MKKLLSGLVLLISLNAFGQAQLNVPNTGRSTVGFTQGMLRIDSVFATSTLDTTKAKEAFPTMRMKGRMAIEGTQYFIHNGVGFVPITGFLSYRDTGRGAAKIVTGGTLNKVRDSLSLYTATGLSGKINWSDTLNRLITTKKYVDSAVAAGGGGGLTDTPSLQMVVDVNKYADSINSSVQWVRNSLTVGDSGAVAGRKFTWMGDSWTEGYGSTVDSAMFATLVTAYFGNITNVNNGVAGAQMQQGTYPNIYSGVGRIADIPAYTKGSLLVYFYGTNDVRYDTTLWSPTGYGLAIDTIAAAAEAEGWPMDHILLIGPAWFYLKEWQNTPVGNIWVTQSRVDRYLAKAQEKATEYGFMYINLRAALEPYGMSVLSIDSIHLNGYGHAVTAQIIEDYLEPYYTVYDSGQTVLKVEGVSQFDYDVFIPALKNVTGSDYFAAFNNVGKLTTVRFDSTKYVRIQSTSPGTKQGTNGNNFNIYGTGRMGGLHVDLDAALFTGTGTPSSGTGLAITTSAGNSIISTNDFGTATPKTLTFNGGGVTFNPAVTFNSTVTTGVSNTQVFFSASGALSGSPNFTYNGTRLTANGDFYNTGSVFGNSPTTALKYWLGADASDNFMGLWGGGATATRTTSNYSFLYDNGSGSALFNAPTGGLLYFRINNADALKINTDKTINMSTTPEYADNAAAVAGGLATGTIYRTGDLLKIVH